MAFGARQREARGRYLAVIGRLKPGVTVRQAQAEMTTIAAALRKEHPDVDSGWGASVEPLRNQLVGGFRAGLLVLIRGRWQPPRRLREPHESVDRAGRRPAAGARGADRARSEPRPSGLHAARRERGHRDRRRGRWRRAGIPRRSRNPRGRPLESSRVLRGERERPGAPLYRRGVHRRRSCFRPPSPLNHRSARVPSRRAPRKRDDRFAPPGPLSGFLVASQVALSVVLLTGAGLLMRTSLPSGASIPAIARKGS